MWESPGILRRLRWGNSTPGEWAGYRRRPDWEVVGLEAAGGGLDFCMATKNKARGTKGLGRGLTRRATGGKGATSLEKYNEKRDFTKSPEPAGKKGAVKGERMFCVQKHLASHLHYDFRLEHRGVLLSWAVPKGPSLNPADKRLAMHVEDHPVAYGSFEGVIPSGYGAGVVLLWDTGTWTPEPGSEDVDAALEKGELKFRLEGVKLKGSWVLVRTGGRRRANSGGKEQWLLIKHRDKWSGEVDVLKLDQSVKSFGGLAEVLGAEEEPGDWKTSPPVKGGETGKLLAEVMGEARGIREGGGKKKVGGKKAAVKKAAPVKKEVVAEAGDDEQPKLSNQTKVLFPKTGFTKGDLVAYYRKVAKWMVPQLAGRAVTLKRYPDGVEGKFFFEKRCAAHRPGWVKTVQVSRVEKDEVIDYCNVDEERTLVWTANMAAIELHVSLAKADTPDRPTAMVFDLDPGAPATVKDCARVALRLRGMLAEMGLEALIKTSGGKGLHLLVPLNNEEASYEQTKTFARAVAMTLERDDPKRVIASMSRSAREGKVFIDWSQNDRNKTTVAVLSVRARETPTISWPLTWEEVEKGKLVSPRADEVELDGKRLGKLLGVLEKVQRLPAGEGREETGQGKAQNRKSEGNSKQKGAKVQKRRGIPNTD